MEETIKHVLDDLLQNGYLSEEDYKNMKPTGSRPGIMYGLCKVHKGITVGSLVPPFRPILSAICTCSYSLAKFFVPQRINEYTIKNSFTFTEEIATLNPDHYMVSFGVESQCLRRYFEIEARIPLFFGDYLSRYIYLHICVRKKICRKASLKSMVLC